MAALPLDESDPMDLADAVVTELRALEWGRPVNIYRAWIDSRGLDELQTLHVAVIPAGDAATISNRKQNEHETPLMLIARRVVNAQDRDQVDGLVRAFAAARSALLGKRPVNFPLAVCTRADLVELADGSQLLQRSLWYASAELLYERRRAMP